jgi:chloramphenicol 3-O phosphotransferase
MSQNKTPSYVIFLNGPSSVGKSSLAEILQERLLPRPFLHIGIDTLIAMMPHSMNNWVGEPVEQGFWWHIVKDEQGHRLAHIQAGPFAQRVSESLMDIAVTLLKNGHNLIIDEVCVSEDNFLAWQRKLSPFKSLYVGLFATTKTLEQREGMRKDRMIGSARAQNLIVHQGNHYDISYDTDHLMLDECADIIIKSLICP